ncbi:MAG: hypothetical protein ACE5Q6_09390 [Dehalococcoidia bacterium]
MIEGKFPLGRLVMTAHLEEVLKESDPENWQEEPNLMVARHAMGEWGEVSEEDQELNEEGLKYGDRLHSVYTTSKGINVWIITESDRSVTTCLLPDDY